ncbi:MAG: prepilin-type N-terminal cleavage/methylation domain-containing protein [Acidobacteria bacterium]|nr:prepilin-type N-terminal cleavage/methylation domain-containing protein [Acidobacteriota bacterium]
MPTSSVGRASNTRSGVTLIEMMIVVVLVSLIVGISFPAVSAGLDSVRLASASTSIASFLAGAITRAERRQEGMEVSILPAENVLRLRSADPRFERVLELPTGAKIQGGARWFLLLPGGPPPRMAIEIASPRGSRRLVRVDPVTGVPQVERPPQ